jgi:hypothetical protein
MREKPEKEKPWAGSKGVLLGRKLLAQLATIVTPETILAWHRKLVGRTMTAGRRPEVDGFRLDPPSTWFGDGYGRARRLPGEFAPSDRKARAALALLTAALRVVLVVFRFDSIARVRKVVEFYVREHNSRLPHSAFHGASRVSGLPTGLSRSSRTRNGQCDRGIGAVDVGYPTNTR